MLTVAIPLTTPADTYWLNGSGLIAAVSKAWTCGKDLEKVCFYAMIDADSCRVMYKVQHMRNT